VASNIVFAVLKPMLAKLSNVIGRGEVYAIALTCYVLGYILRASCTSFDTYAGGTIFASVGQTAANMMNDVVISDISTMRWRGFALSASFIPFFITPWISGFIVEDVVAPDGIGWRLGIGMFA
jgi:MFS family permease